MQPDRLKMQIEACVEEQTLLYAVLSRPSVKDSKASKITIRPLTTKEGLLYQMSTHQSQKVLHSNCKPSEILAVLWPLIGDGFREASFFTAEADYQVLVNKKKQWTILRHKPTRQAAVQAHNRSKCYLLEEGQPIPFLIELGVMRPDGSLIPKMAHKFKQINRFVEIVADIFPHLPADRPLNIVDFGCGKSYLTFALYHYLHVIQKKEVNIIGLDLKADVISCCGILAEKSGYRGLHFQVGDIKAHETDRKVDMVVSLHACDTATDAALQKAIDWQAEVILCVPCCQHELYGQVENAILSPLLKHGILRERFAALATDAARAQLLEIAGYRTQVMEFIDMEHTPKNIMIRAVRSPAPQNAAAALAAYKAFTDFLRITPALQKMQKGI